MAWQAGEVGDKLGDASQQINGHTDDLNTMSDGAKQLADALGDFRNQVDQALPNISGLVDTSDFPAEEFRRAQDAQRTRQRRQADHQHASLGQTLDLNIADVNNIAGLARPILNALDATPVCSLDPTASTLAVSYSALPMHTTVVR